MALSGIFMGIPLSRRPCRCNVGVGCFSLAALLVFFFIIINYSFSPWTLRRQFTGESAINYARLQPLREMFANASKVKETGQRSNPKGSTLQRKAASMLNVSDLQEVRNKESVLLLLIVTTAPSRYDRRKAIRDTWWKKCDGNEVSLKAATIKFRYKQFRPPLPPIPPLNRPLIIRSQKLSDNDIPFLSLRRTL